MYSMVLMMAMSASPEAAAFGNKGCNGCYGSCQGSYASSCHGCHGSRHSCHGCSGYTSCHGCSGYTSCHGCSGYTSCHGCHGGGRGMFGRSHHSCHGCSGYTSCHGCSGYSSCSGYGCTGNSCYGGNYYGAPGVIVTPNETKDMPIPKKISAPATIEVSVPADAAITIDGAPTKSTSSVRIFATPELAIGTVYYYTISASVVREGKTFTATEKVAVEAGVNAQISLSPNAAVVASK